MFSPQKVVIILQCFGSNQYVVYLKLIQCMSITYFFKSQPVWRDVLCMGQQWRRAKKSHLKAILCVTLTKSFLIRTLKSFWVFSVYQKYDYEQGRRMLILSTFYVPDHAKHFARVTSLHSHHSPTAGIITFTLRVHSWGTAFSHLLKVTQPELCAWGRSPWPRHGSLSSLLYSVASFSSVVLVSHTSQFLLLLGYKGPSAFYNMAYSFPNRGHTMQ